jgi:hypothetical protein
MTKTVSAVEARHNLGHLLNLVSLTHTQVTIERSGKKIATLSEYKEGDESQPDAPVGKLHIADIEGLGKEIWTDVNVDEYIQQERSSWD